MNYLIIKAIIAKLQPTTVALQKYMLAGCTIKNLMTGKDIDAMWDILDFTLTKNLIFGQVNAETITLEIH